MDEERRPSLAERRRRATIVFWVIAGPCLVAGWLIGMVALGGKSPTLLWTALAICVLDFAAGMLAGRFYVQGGATGRAPEA
jgi:hypothetical protein